MVYIVLFFFFKQKTAYEMRISDWSSDVCSSDLLFGTPSVALYWHIGDSTMRFGRVTDRSWSGSKRAAMVLSRISCRRAVPSVGHLLQRSSQIGRASCREKSVSVRVDLGGRRIIKKKKQK